MSESIFRIIPWTALAAVALLGTSASAHHSTAMFKWGEESRIKGTIKTYQWTNPHTWIVLVVARPSGHTEEWNFEGMSPNYLGRHGWSKSTLKPGDEIEMGYYALRDGRKGGFTANVRLSGGQTLSATPTVDRSGDSGTPPSPAAEATTVR